MTTLLQKTGLWRRCSNRHRLIKAFKIHLGYRIMFPTKATDWPHSRDTYQTRPRSRIFKPRQIIWSTKPNRGSSQHIKSSTSSEITTTLWQISGAKALSRGQDRTWIYQNTQTTLRRNTWKSRISSTPNTSIWIKNNINQTNL